MTDTTKWVVIWIATLGLAALVGTALAAFIRPYLEPEPVPASSDVALSTPPPGGVLPSGSPVQVSSPVPSPAASPAPVAGSPLPAATAISVPVPAATPTVLPAPAAALAPAPVPATTMRTVLEERFADNPAGWPDDPESTAWLADGTYRLLARRAGEFVAIPAPVTESFRDVSVTGIFRKVGGPPGGGYGLIVRGQGPWGRPGFSQGVRFYVLEAGDRGEVGIWRREEDRWVDLLPWTPSGAARPGTAPNELRVDAIGPQLAFVVNDTRVVTLNDPVLERGTVGVFVGGDFNEVVLERFVIQAAP